MRNSRFMVSVRSYVTGKHLRYVTVHEARLMCAEDAEGDPLPDVEAVAVRISRKKAALKDIKLRQLNREATGSPCAISAKESWLNALGESGLALRPSDSIAQMNGIAAKIRYQAEASENNRSVTVVPGKIIGLTECAL